MRCQQCANSAEVLKLIAEITTTTVLSAKSRPVTRNYPTCVMISGADAPAKTPRAASAACALVSRQNPN